MKAIDIISYLHSGATIDKNCCDTVKSGIVDKTVKNVVVTLMATAEVIKKAISLKADMIITHEPTYYDHMDVYKDLPVVNLKKKLIEDSKITIFRYHDIMHGKFPDQITEGAIKYLNLNGKLEKTPYFASYILTLVEPISAIEIAKRFEENLGVKHVKIAGERNKKCTKIAMCLGTPGGVYELLTESDAEIVITGETCEWRHAEYARDAVSFGLNKSMLVIGHIGSERDGMRLLTKDLQDKFTSVNFIYVDCEEVYTYLD